MTPEDTADLVLRLTREKRELTERLETTLEAARALSSGLTEIQEALGLPAGPLLSSADLVTEIERLRTELRFEATPAAGAEGFFTDKEEGPNDIAVWRHDPKAPNMPTFVGYADPRSVNANEELLGYAVTALGIPTREEFEARQAERKAQEVEG